MTFPSLKRYQITTTLENYNKNLEILKTISTFKTRIDNEKVIFYSNNKLDIEGFDCANYTKHILRKIFLLNLLLVLIIGLVIAILFVSPNYIKEIKYKDGSVKDEIVYNNLITKVETNKKPNLKEISKELMIMFPHYSWIEAKKVGRVIYLYIELNQVGDVEIKNNLINGDLISGYNAYIKKIIATKGKPMIDINQTVKIGDVLIAGQIKNQKIPPNGVVIGEIVYTKEIVIKKTDVIYSYTGNLLQYRYLNIGKLLLKKKKNNYINFKTKQNIVFNLFDYIRLIDETVYEFDNYTINHNKDSAIEYAKSFIYYKFEKYKTSNLEKILTIDLVEIIENDNAFIVKLLIKADKNIVVLKQY